MSYPSALDIARDGARGLTSIYKYGHAAGVGTDFVPVTTGQLLQLPTPSNAAPLRAVSTSSDDTNGGVGAWSIVVVGLDALGEEVTETITLDGTTPSAYTTTEFWRVNFVDVSQSGTYATLTSPSHVGDITVSDGTNDWACIDSNGYPHSRWQSAIYTVPLGKVAYVADFMVATDSGKLADFKVIARRDATNETSPYSPAPELLELTGISGVYSQDLNFAFGPIPALTDFGFIGRLTQTPAASLSAGFTIIISDGPN